jgi:hypothetical protein
MDAGIPLTMVGASRVLALRDAATGRLDLAWRGFAFAAVKEAAFYRLLRPSEALAMRPGLVSTPEPSSGLLGKREIPTTTTLPELAPRAAWYI